MIRQSDLDDVIRYFDMRARQFARSSETTEFDKLVETAQRSIDNNEGDFIEHLDELWSRTWQILWRQDEFIIQQFIRLSKSRHTFEDKDRFDELIHIGMKLIEHPEIKEIVDGKRIGTIKSEVVEQLKLIVFQIFEIPRIKGSSHRDIMRDLDTNVS